MNLLGAEAVLEFGSSPRSGTGDEVGTGAGHGATRVRIPRQPQERPAVPRDALHRPDAKSSAAG